MMLLVVAVNVCWKCGVYRHLEDLVSYLKIYDLFLRVSKQTLATAMSEGSLMELLNIWGVIPAALWNMSNTLHYFFIILNWVL